MGKRLVKFEDRDTVNKVIAKLSVRTCPYCSNEYVIGRTGVVDGCDQCIGIIRNKEGMIVGTYDPQDMPK